MRPDEEKISEENPAMVLALAISAIVFGVLAFWYSIETFGMGIVVLAPAIGAGMLIAAVICFRWLSRIDARRESRALLISARIASGLVMLLGLVGLSFFMMRGAGIYK